MYYHPITHIAAVRKICGSITGPIKSPPLRCFFVAVLSRRWATEMDPTTRHTLRRNTASIMKIWFFWCMYPIDVAQEKTMEEIPLFRRESLKQIEMVEKNTLPSSESE